MSYLTAKEIAFVNEYVKHGIGSKAVIDAGYSESGASVTANRLLKRAHVAAEIARRRLPIEKKSQLNAEKIYEALNNLVDFDPAQLFDAAGNFLPINKMPPEARKAIAGFDLSKNSVKLSSRLGAIELSAKLLGMVKQEQSQQQAVQIIIASPPELPVVAQPLVQLKPEWD